MRLPEMTPVDKDVTIALIEEIVGLFEELADSIRCDNEEKFDELKNKIDELLED